MGFRLVSRRVFDNALLSGVTGSGVASSAIDLRMGVFRLESLLFLASSVVSNPDISFEYAISRDGVTWGSYADNTSLLTSTVSMTNPQGWHAVPMPAALAPFLRFQCSATGSNPVDTRVTADLWLTMTQ
jgi:hypothetical protein